MARSIPRPIGACLAAALTLAAPASARAQEAGSRPEKGGAERERGFSYGGSFTGRMNLIGPEATKAPDLLSPRPQLPSPSLGGRSLRPGANDPLGGLNLPALGPQPKPGTPASPAAPSGVAALPPAAAATIVKQTLALHAAFDAKGGRIPNGLKWRVFTDRPDANGEHMLVAESSSAAPRFDLDPGGYIVHAVYGLVSTARYVVVGPRAGREETIVMPTGAVRLTALVGDVKIPADRISFTLTRDEGGVTRTVTDKAPPGEVLRLPAGAYHVVSSYGDANAIVEVDLDVPAGKFVEAQVHHKAARMTLKLVDAPGGPELSDTSWTILTPGGDVIRESIGQLPPIVLSEGEYTAIVRRYGHMQQKTFEVRAGFDATVEIQAADG
ncbi:hypothetical protein GCM10008171_09560 [Methylopila jiangsuensis]|uniref:Uncharacterized protein n=1 Tax=Methylopila jiangsuensis TaxID=586230 RepID=A0A9W6N348_9HYPH|nr:hypothetical protein [Methylopila jiangsuensis]MDR6285945.1 hypothetical protein [Methylopila jiangsuensis]GLK75702.1 hypothetical protein GCM10008171_09560 [Methylopila jiangsuensis]